MKEIKQSLTDLIGSNPKLTYLVGAGCSIDPPSCLPAGRGMMESIIKFACAEAEIEKVLGLEDLRFETLVEIIRDLLDDDLKLIDYYEQCEQPNLQHFFLAEMIMKGHFVMTTNFDFLIEHALLKAGVPKRQICPVITKTDFEKFQDPNKLLQKGIKGVYKIHGSTKNIISGEDTRSSLIATIQAFGTNKEGLNVFQIEPFKMPFFYNISKGRTLIIMGYSGSDDFDIVPTLISLKNLNSLIWIYHVPNIEGSEKITEFEVDLNQDLNQISKVDQILTTFKRFHKSTRVFKIDVNTKSLITKLLGKEPNIDLNPFSGNPFTWLKDNIHLPDDLVELVQLFIPLKIYRDLDMYEDTLRCAHKLLAIAEKAQNQEWKLIAINEIGLIYRTQGNYSDALKQFEIALQIAKQLNLPSKAAIINNLGDIYQSQENYSEALKRYEMALEIDEQSENFTGAAFDLNNIGNIYHTQGNYSEALKYYEAALRIDEQLGDLRGKATRLNNIGEIYRLKGKYSEALKKFDEALKIADRLGALQTKVVGLNNIANIYIVKENYSEALKNFEEALEIADNLGDLNMKFLLFINIGVLYDNQGNLPEALKQYEAAFQIAVQLDDHTKEINTLIHIGIMYTVLEDYPEALKRVNAAIKIAKQIGDVKLEALGLNSLGEIYRIQEDYEDALDFYDAALKLLTQCGLGKSPEAKDISDNFREVQKLMKDG